VSASTNWYVVKSSSLELSSPPPLPISSPMCDSEGEDIYDGRVPIRIGELKQGVPVEAVDHLTLVINRRILIGDCLAYSFGTRLIVADRVWRAICDAGLKPAAHHPLALKILASRRGPVRAEYVIIWNKQQYDVLDRAKSVVRTFPGTDVIAEVVKWSLNDGEWRELDLVPSKSNDLLASQKFVDLIRDSGFSGFEFRSV
jgi:hypothetical protein